MGKQWNIYDLGIQCKISDDWMLIYEINDAPDIVKSFVQGRTSVFPASVNNTAYHINGSSVAFIVLPNIYDKGVEAFSKYIKQEKIFVQEKTKVKQIFWRDEPAYLATGLVSDKCINNNDNDNQEYKTQIVLFRYLNIDIGLVVTQIRNHDPNLIIKILNSIEPIKQEDITVNRWKPFRLDRCPVQINAPVSWSFVKDKEVDGGAFYIDEPPIVVSFLAEKIDQVHTLEDFEKKLQGVNDPLVKTQKRVKIQDHEALDNYLESNIAFPVTRPEILVRGREINLVVDNYLVILYIMTTGPNWDRIQSIVDKIVTSLKILL